MNNSFRYSLGKIIAICPQCGRRCFKPYVDNSTGRPLDVRFCGRCNRENSCRYHLTPSQWFHDHGVPHHGVATSTSPRRWTPPPPPPPPSFIKLPPTPELHQFEDDPLFRWLCTRFDRDSVIGAFRLYRVSHFAWHGGATAFYLIDSQLRCRSAKLMRYGPDGHRLRSDNPAQNVSWLHSVSHLRGYNFRACFFGEHIAALRPAATICIVESEKTALIMACNENSGRFVYLATGGCSALCHCNSNLSDPYSRFNILRGRHVILYPDADMIPKWKAAADELVGICASVRAVDITAPPFSLTASADIGDWLCPG